MRFYIWREYIQGFRALGMDGWGLGVWRGCSSRGMFVKAL